MKRILILGGTGFIGRNLARIYRGMGHEVKATDSVGKVNELILNFHLVINATGKKDIPRCEMHPREAYEANAMHAGMWAAITKPITKFVHISSDHAYAEGVASQTVYARSKRLGDELVMAENPNAMIVVTGHVYAKDCGWVKWVDGELRAGRKVIAHNNRVNRPTWIGDLANFILMAVELGSVGTIFGVGPELVTRGQLFRAYARAAGLDEGLIVDGTCDDPLLAGTIDVEHAKRFKGVEEGFREMLNG